MQTVIELLRKKKINTDYVKLSELDSYDIVFLSDAEAIVKELTERKCQNCSFNKHERYGEQSEIQTQTCSNSKSLMYNKSVDDAYKTNFYCSAWEKE